MSKLRLFSSLPIGATFEFQPGPNITPNPVGPWVKVSATTRMRPSQFGVEEAVGSANLPVFAKSPQPLAAVIIRAVKSDDFDTALAQLQRHLGETDGGFAGVHYSGGDAGEIVWRWHTFPMARRVRELFTYVSASSKWRGC